MNIQVEDMKRCKVIKVSGQVNSARAPELEEVLLDEIQQGTNNLVVNLGDVEFISSAGVTALLRARIRLRRKVPPGEIVISELSPNLKSTFELVGMNYLFQFYDRNIDAVDSF